MSNIHILVAEDDRNIRNGLVDTLESEGYKVQTADDGQQALDMFAERKFGLVMLDVMMPRKSGYDVCREIRMTNQDVPIIMLTAKGEEIDKVVGLQLGADDYVTKPFGVHELLARIEAVLRRTRTSRSPAKKASKPGARKFRFGAADIDTRQYKARSSKKTYDLSAKEVQLICFFKEHPNEVLSRDEILNEVWGINYFGTTRTLDQHIAQLRKKVEPKSKRGQVISTVHGVGYKYVP